MRASGGRPRAFHLLQMCVCGAAAALLAALSPGVPWERLPEILFFTALGVLAFRLRVRYGGNYVGLEAAALAPAILLLRSPGAAMLVCAAADAIAKQFTKNRRWTLSSAFDLAQLSLAYAAAALFADALHAVGGGPVALAALAVAVLLVFFLVNTALVFAYLDLSGLVPRQRLPEIALFQFVALALLAPIVVLEVLVYPAYGAAGTLLAFFPVALASVVMRNLSSMQRRVEEVSRQNRELDVMRDISVTFGVSARVDRYERVFTAVARLLPVEAMAVIEWTGDTDDDLAVHLSEGAEATRGEVLAWARRSRLDERRVDRAAGSARSRPVTPARCAWPPGPRTRCASPCPRSRCTRAFSCSRVAPPRSTRRNPWPRSGRSPTTSRWCSRTGPSGRRCKSSPSATGNGPRLSTRSWRSRTTSSATARSTTSSSRSRRRSPGAWGSSRSCCRSTTGNRTSSRRARTSAWTSAGRRCAPRASRRGNHEALERPQPGLEVLPRTRARVPRGRLRRRVVAPGTRRRRGGLESERAALDPALLGGPPPRLPPRRRAAQRPLPLPRNDPVARDLREPGRGGHRERALLQRGARAVDPRLPDGRLQPPPLPGRPAAGARTCRASRTAPDGPDARHRRLQVDQRPFRPPGRRRDPAGHRRRDPQRGPRRHGPARPLRRRRVRAGAVPRRPSPTPSSWPSVCGDAWTNGSSACRIRTRSSGRRSRSAWRLIPTTPPRRRTSSTRPTPRSTAPSTAARTRSSRPPSRDRDNSLCFRTERAPSPSLGPAPGAKARLAGSRARHGRDPVLR